MADYKEILMELKTFVWLAGVLLILTIFAFGMNEISKSMEKKSTTTIQFTSSPQNCSDGETKTCTSGICTGLRTCRGGQWGDCSVNQLCSPGSKVSCSENGCINGQKICNACGTGYGICTPVTARSQ